MTIAVDWNIKHQGKQVKLIYTDNIVGGCEAKVWSKDIYANFISSGSTLFVKVKMIFRQKMQYFFFKLQPDTPGYIQWTFSSLLYHIKWKNPSEY